MGVPNGNVEKFEHTNGVEKKENGSKVTKSKPVNVLPMGEKSSPKGIYMLSNLDQTFPYPIEILFAFEKVNNTINCVEILKESLSKALDEFYPLAWKVDVSWDGKMMVNSNAGDCGVPFLEAFCNEEMAVTIGDDITKIDLKLADYVYSGEKPYHTILDVPALSVQVTTFKCGGIILGVGFNHILMDGRSFADFLIYWCQITKKSHLSIPPHLDSSILSSRQPPKIQNSHPEYSKSKAPLIPQLTQKQIKINKSFTFTPLNLSLLNKLAMQNNPNFTPTAFELISAVIWICWTKALKLSPTKTTQILTAVDGRQKFDPPLPKPYFGNGIVWSCARSKVDDLTRAPFSFAVRIVQEAIKEVTEEYIRSAIDYHELTRKPLEQENTLWITKWSRLPFYEVDFMWGEPRQVAPASLVDNLVVTLSEGNKSEKLVVSLSLPAEAMEIFEEQMELKLKLN
ncbi:hypothetical protein ACJIZ3_011195 [Penstemon smallii]|uniref:Uncharacterized protein n=1 Tax=Penstemon smallii TaxID=265156 RepID=A0ABD3ULM5_9LAMI